MRQSSTIAFMAALLVPFAASQCMDRSADCYPLAICNSMGPSQVCGNTERVQGECVKVTNEERGYVAVSTIYRAKNITDDICNSAVAVKPDFIWLHPHASLRP
ncbi:hypothetical protein CGCA056_v010084 [Colletotrichum aenigma]|uniref:uncharacterized protein n=1 Tax=Colletotrichum aenigma TaxID=1215731 RepID=UPI001872F9EB|nr:uncharacterized protein CGCA056_v010084 [Colletotrichum aenigma]KAF5519064.1 hypothetical protein CGCA056_v010084 [Colletotrichum aenigma]